MYRVYWIVWEYDEFECNHSDFKTQEDAIAFITRNTYDNGVFNNFDVISIIDISSELKDVWEAGIQASLDKAKTDFLNSPEQIAKRKKQEEDEKDIARDFLRTLNSNVDEGLHLYE